MSMGIIESGEYNKVAGNADGIVNVIESNTLITSTLPAGTATTIAQVTLPKGKWMVFGQLKTASAADNMLLLAISKYGTVHPSEIVDQIQQVQTIDSYAHGMLPLTLDAETTIKLVGISTSAALNISRAEIAAIKVSD